MELTIKTNRVPRLLLDWHELSDKERADFDYFDEPESASFFRYRGHVYDVGEFMRVPEPLKGWDGYQSDSYFSGIVIRLVDDDSVICGTYFS